MFRCLVIAVLSLALLSPAYAVDSLVSVQGEGTVSAAPDVAYVNVGVVAEGDDAATALSANTVKMKELVAVVKSLGLAENEIQTNQFRLEAKYKYDSVKQEQIFVGYICVNTVTLTVCKLGDVGKVLTAAVEKGGNVVQGVSFAIKDRKPLLEQARVLAVQSATQKAQTLVTTAGAKVGKLKSISENSMGYVAPKSYSARMADAPGGNAPISGGELSVTVSVSATFEIE